ncbi:hypothetical protein [Streptomyces thermocarboxydus]|uniref:hypothetical protein n=1 Tax=Streptomyces thermocarboxydus TaxID=59299 RepID=UPI00307B1C5F
MGAEILDVQVDLVDLEQRDVEEHVRVRRGGRGPGDGLLVTLPVGLLDLGDAVLGITVLEVAVLEVVLGFAVLGVVLGVVGVAAHHRTSRVAGPLVPILRRAALRRTVSRARRPRPAAARAPDARRRSWRRAGC